MKLKTLLFLFFATTVYSQDRLTALSSKKLDPFKCYYYQSIRNENTDTAYFIKLMFIDLKYAALEEYESIYLESEDVKKEFIADLLAANKEINNKESTLSWERHDYKIYKFSKFKKIYVYDSKSRYYTAVLPSQLGRLLDWLYHMPIGSSEIEKSYK